ncbi:MAG: hypothetical protein HON62_08340, partial [Rhodospirillaceae bacterium]|nr:hypothetical protein [Rhodospirillaceae bacterium]
MKSFLSRHLGNGEGRSRLGLAFVVFTIAAFSLWGVLPGAFAQGVSKWQREFPATNFDTRIIELDEINDDGNTRDSIQPVREPKYVSVAEVKDMGP